MDEEIDIPIDLDLSSVRQAMAGFRAQLTAGQEAVQDVVATQLELTPAVDASREAMSELRQATEIVQLEFGELTSHVTTGLAEHRTLVTQAASAWEDLGAVVTGNVEQLDDVVDHANKAAVSLRNVNQAIRGAGGNIPESIGASIHALDELALSAKSVGSEMYVSSTLMSGMLGVSGKMAAMTLPATLTNVSAASAAVSWNMWRAGAVAASTWAFIPAKIIGVAQAIFGLLKMFAPLIQGLRFIAVQAAAAGKSLWFIGQIASTMSAALMAFATVVKTVFMTVKLSVMIALSPFWLMWKAITSVTKAVWAVVKPALRLWLAWQGLKIQLEATKLAFKWMAKFIGALSPKMRFLFFAVTALGLSARTTAWAATVLAKALGILNIGSRLLRATFGALINPVGAVREMMLLLRDATLLTARILAKLALSAYAAGAALARLGASSVVSGLRAAGDVTANMAARMWQLRATVASLATLFAMGFGLWGVKLQAQAETAHIPFKNLLGSVERGQKMLQNIEDFAATTPFKNADIQEGGRSLLTAGIAAGSLIEDLRMLGDVASGTQKPLLDYTRIYSQIRTNGRATTEHIKQLADRTVPIWQALMRTMGVDSQDEIRRMATAGEIGFADIRKALQLTTSDLNDGIGAAGIFANATMEQSQTLSGLYSTLKDNIGFVARAFGDQISGATGLKGLLSGVIVQLQVWRSRVHEVRPAIIATYQLMIQSFRSMRELITAVAESFGLRSGDMVASFVEVATIVKWSMAEWPTIADFVFTRLQFFAVRFGNQVVYWLTEAIPSAFFQLDKLGAAVLNKFSEAMEAVINMDFTGAAAALKEGLDAEGFKLPERVAGDLEKELDRAAKSLEDSMSSSLEKELVASTDMIRKTREEQARLAKERDEMLANTGFGSDGEGDGDQEVKKTMSVVVESAERDSAEAFRAIFQRTERNTLQKQQVTEQKKTNTILSGIKQDLASGDAIEIVGAVS